jgi:hypothetical protein
MVSRINCCYFTGIIVYANRTYLNQPEGIKIMAFGIKTLLAKEAGLDDWYCIDSFILFCIGFKYLGAQSRWWCNTGIVGFLIH